MLISDHCVESEKIIEAPRPSKICPTTIAGRAATRNSYKDVYARLVSRGLKLPTKKKYLR